MKRIELFTTALAAALLMSSILAPLSRAGFEEGVTAYEAKDYMTAFEEWLPLAKKNDPAAMRNIGHMYRRGLGVPQDFGKAMTWYKRAATIGFDRAQANVAGMYLAGEGVKQDYAQAANWFARAAQQGHVISQYNLALLLENGLGVQKDERMALGWFELAAKAGHPGATKRAAELTAELKTRPPVIADASSQQTAQMTESADAAETDVSTQSAAQSATSEQDTTATEKTPAMAETQSAENSGSAKPATVAAATATASDPASSDGVQKKGFYEALRSLVTKKAAEENAVEPAVPAPSVAAVETPKDVAATNAIEPATSGAVTRAEEPPTPAAKPTDKQVVAAAQQEPVKVASAPAPAEAKTAPKPSAPANAVPGSGLSMAEKLEMADLAYTLQQYQQSLSIWAPLAADGNVEAQYRLGILFNNGQGVPVDRVRAYYWWDKAQKNGSTAAASAIGNLEQTLTHLEKRQIDRVN